MQELIVNLNKRRMIAMIVVCVLAIVGLAVSYNFKITPSVYFEGRYNGIFIASLIIYKIIELSILYYLLFHRHFIRLKKNSNPEEYLPKLRKHSKLLFFLIPQGNTIFGIIAYKLSGNVEYFLIFSSIALMTLFIINPNILNVTKSKCI